MNNIVQPRMGQGLMCRQCFFNERGNGAERNAAAQKMLDGNFIGGIQHRRSRPAGLQRAKGQRKTAEFLHIRGKKCHPGQRGEIQTRKCRSGTFGICQRILDGQLHVRYAQLGLHRAIHKFDHGMDDGLGMNDDLDF